MKIILTIASFFLWSVAAVVHAADPDHRGELRNDVLFIAIDDLNDWTTLFDKNNPIQTPNLERLAARGAFFTRAYCASPGCNPSRAAILTGLRPTTSGVYHNRDTWREVLPNAVTLPGYFGQHGYRTEGGGKVFHHEPANGDDSDHLSFHEFFPMKDLSRIETPNGLVDKHFPTPKIRKGAFAAIDWGPVTVPLTDDFTLDWARQKLQETPDGPRFLAVGFFHPHLPHFAPPAFFERYPFSTVVQPPMPADDLDDVPPLGLRMARKESWYHHLFVDPPADDEPGSLKNLVRSYQASASYADANVGQLLDQLDASSRADNTIIVLWSDHGYHLGDKQSAVKFTLWEKANHVPFIIVAPGVTKPGARIDVPVSLVDIYPTLIELAGLPEKPGLDGQSLVPLLKNPLAEWDRPPLMTQGRGNHAVRTGRWRYIRYSDGTEELYDCKTDDPWNHNNLLAGEDSARYEKIAAELRTWLPLSETTRD